MSDRFDTDALRQWDAGIAVGDITPAQWGQMVADLHAAADRIDRLEDGLVAIRDGLVGVASRYARNLLDPEGLT